MHGHHGHAHTRDRAHVAPALHHKRYTIAIALNLGFVLVEAAAGFYANSAALLADAAHNLSDVLGLALAGGATWLAQRRAGAQRTYGFAKATVLAALANGLVLVMACAGILWEALSRLAAPEAVQPHVVIAAASAGVLVNGATALLFVAGRERDVNVRAAFLHMIADAGVSAAVIAAGAAMLVTGYVWIDPIISLAVVALIMWGAWGLLSESLDLALDAAPTHIDVAAVQAYLAGQPGVTAVHDLHVWAMGATEPALTAHLVRPEGGDDAFLAAVVDGLFDRFGISHVTVQIERVARESCTVCRR